MKSEQLVAALLGPAVALACAAGAMATRPMSPLNTPLS